MSVAGAVVVACSSDSDDGGSGDADADPLTTPPPTAMANVETGPDGMPTEAAMMAWITTIFDQGVRRPGMPADVWAEEFTRATFESLGMENVRAEPLEATVWDHGEWSVVVTTADGTDHELDAFPVPFSASADALELEVVAWDADNPAAVDGKASLYDMSLITLPAAFLATSGDVPDDLTGRIVDPDGSFAADTHTVPFGTEFQDVMEPSMDAGAAAFVGTLQNYPGDSNKYFVPYDGHGRPIPGVWLSDTDGQWLHAQLADGPVRIRLDISSSIETITTHNVVGELPGADDDVVMVASHHDAPWASAVEDASGMALVYAQATYWAGRPVEERPHRMVFLLQGGHMAGGAGLHAFIEEHRQELADVVLEVHLEHAALEADAGPDGSVVVSDRATPRWWFTSRIPRLEDAVSTALHEHELTRSIVMAPNAFGDQPPTDGAFYHSEGVPIVNFLSAPHYLFDEMDTPDKIDRANLVPISEAVVDIISSTAGVSAQQMRAEVVV